MNRIPELLEKIGMTQRELADRVGVTEVTISRYVNERREPRVSTGLLIAEILNADVRDVFPPDERRS